MLFVAISSYFVSKGEPEELIKHGLRALRETLPNEQELTTKVCLASVNIQALSFWYWFFLKFDVCLLGSYADLLDLVFSPVLVQF